MIFKRPLSLLTALVAVLVIVYEVIQIASGELYQKALNNMDGTTLIELGILMLLGVFVLRDRSDLHAVSFTLVAGLSFIFIYEAIYKWSFYLAPFVKPMPPIEIREFVIQSGIALTVLTGFAIRDFTLKKWTFIWLGLFVILWIFWLLTGYPQITGELIFSKTLPVDFTHEALYILNRGTKFVMYLAYLSLFPALRKLDHPAALTGTQQDTMKISRLIRSGLALLALSGALTGCLPLTSTGEAPAATLLPRDTATPPPETSIPRTTVEPTRVAFQSSLRQSDGMTMVNIPAGKFMMGSAEGEADEGPVHEVYLDAFWMDQTEVTNAVYALCVEADACLPPMETGSYTRVDYYGNRNYADYPVIFVDWNMANAYCKWAEARLPTEAEWEKAARGEEGHLYPWGDDWDVQAKKRLNFADKNNPETTSDLGADDGYRDTAPVRSYPAGKSSYGLYDLAGNVWEWAADWYDPLYYFDAPVNNPPGPTETSLRALRGGSWVAANQDVFHTSNRNGLEPSKFSSSVGFRCAR